MSVKPARRWRNVRCGRPPECRAQSTGARSGAGPVSTLARRPSTVCCVPTSARPASTRPSAAPSGWPGSTAAAICRPVRPASSPAPPSGTAGRCARANAPSRRPSLGSIRSWIATSSVGGRRSGRVSLSYRDIWPATFAHGDGRIENIDSAFSLKSTVALNQWFPSKLVSYLTNSEGRGRTFLIEIYPTFHELLINI